MACGPGDTRGGLFLARIEKLIAERFRGNASALERASGLTPNIISRWRSEGSMPGADFLARIVKGTGCDARWLLTGQGEAFPEQPALASIKTFITGGGMNWQVSDELEAYDTTVPGDLIAFEVRGDSMQPLALDGQVVLALRDVRPTDGDLAVIEMKDGTHSFKRIHIHGEQWILVAINPTHEPHVCGERAIQRAMKVWGVKF